MTDLEMTKLCAEAMGYKWNDGGGVIVLSEYRLIYDPLRDDAQAMALVKRFTLTVAQDGSGEWEIWHRQSGWVILNLSLNRAIVECVAKIQKAKNV